MGEFLKSVTAKLLCWFAIILCSFIFVETSLTSYTVQDIPPI